LATALDAIADGSRVFVSGGSATPKVIDQAMAAERHRWSTLDLVCDRLVEPLAVFDFPNEPFRLVSLQPSPAVDTMRNAGALTSDAGQFSRFGELMSSAGSWPIDVAIIHVSPPGPEGRYSLGVSVATPLAAIAEASLVIAQVNPRMPYSYGAAELDPDEIDLLVDAESELVETVRRPPDETALVIGTLVASVVSNGATLQLGVGALADAVMMALVDHTDLAIHSGMISDGVIDLQASGAITGASHPLFPGHIVTGLVGGTRAAFDFIDHNPVVVMAPAAVTHGQKLLTSLGGFTAINSAVEVAIDGSANGEMIGDRVVSGPGGAPDYALAAATAPGGRYIVALPATASSGRRSRIVDRLAAGAPATVAGQYVSTVVTEFGVASIAELSGQDRAEALLSIAAPAFRSTD
jgi:acyl-CoA hydrolase